ncbi:MAG: DUF3553 domain-containing protein [Planctomycetota bacterium]
MSDPAPIFVRDDRVRHAEKPEWGEGRVESAQNLMVNGTRCQRLEVRFARAGLKKVLTAAAKIVPADTVTIPASSVDAPAGPIEDPFETHKPEEIFAALPPIVNEDAAPLPDRITELLKLYRFRQHDASLLDWAATQAGMTDPLERFTRAQLEQLFERFAWKRDNALKDLVTKLARRDRARAQSLLAQAPPPAREALARLNARR